MEIVISDEAYKQDSGPLLLLAGPGTGKTFQLAKRIQYLTENGTSPDEITVITFTREAAKSMREKLEKKGNEHIEPAKRPNRISTMHSLCDSILRENAKAIGFSEDFQILESAENLH